MQLLAGSWIPTRRLSVLRTDPAGNQRHCQYPYSYIAAFIKSTAPRKNAGISSTMIAAECVRRAVWEPQKPYGLFPHEAQASMSGTARHEFYERHNEEGILAEVRLAIRMPSGRVITGQIDRYLPDHHRIEDYKFKTEDHTPFNKAPLNYVACSLPRKLVHPIG